MPIRCFRCEGEYTVPYATYRAGTVFRCPHCLASLVPTLSMVRAVREAVEQFHAQWSATFERLHEKRRRELELFLDNWVRYRRGDPLRNLVDKDAGY